MDEPPPRARVTRRLPIVLALAVALFAIPALTATNAVPTTHAGTTATLGVCRPPARAGIPQSRSRTRQ